MAKIKTIGILAGMGPRSTAPFIDLVLDECQAQYGAKFDVDFPHMIIYSLPTPFFVDRPIDHGKMVATLRSGLRILEEARVDFIAIPCNTVHAYFSELCTAVSVPILNIIDETLARVPSELKKLAIFATQPTIDSGVYQRGIEHLGKEVIDPKPYQSLVNALIASTKSQAPDTAGEWNRLLETAANLGAQAAVIACTDLCSYAKKTSPIFLVDSSGALAKAVVNRYLQ